MSIITESTKSFKEFEDFIKHLNFVEELTEWKETETTTLDVKSSANTNPFPQLGGDEYGVDISFNSGMTYIPMRDTCFNTLLSRAEISGQGITRLFEADKEVFCDHINQYVSLKKRKKILALIQDEKVSAIHSGNYSPISMASIFETCKKYLDERFSRVQPISSEWSWESSSFFWEIRDKYITDVYEQFLGKYMTATSAKAQLRVLSSDVQESAVKMYPYIVVNNDISIPLSGIGAIKHIGSNNIGTVYNQIENSFTKFEASCRSLGGLSDVLINHAKNTMIKAFTWLKIPQKYCSIIADVQSNDTPTDALYIYTTMCKVTDIMMKKEAKQLDIIRVEELLCRLITMNATKWHDFDVAGEVKWNAKD